MANEREDECDVGSVISAPLFTSAAMVSECFEAIAGSRVRLHIV